MTSNGRVFYSPQIRKILTFMSKYHKEHEAYPKLNEIGKSLNVSKQRIGVLLKQAEQLGLVQSHNYFMRKYSLNNLAKEGKLKVNNYYEL